MKKTFLALGLAGALAGFGCETQDDEVSTGDEVEAELQDLQAARQAAPQEAQELQRELQQTEQRVAQLQEELVRARRGMTGEVMEEREDLEAALNEQEVAVTEEMREAAQLAEEHNQEARAAQQALERGERITDVETEVQTETDVQTAQPTVQERTVEREIEVERTELLEDQRQAERARQRQRQEG